MQQDFPHNQLYFTARATPPAAVSKYHPEALIVERCGPLLRKTAPDLPAFRFSEVDPDNLSAAIQLARRDVRRQRWEEEMRETLRDSAGKKGKKGKGRGAAYARAAHSRDFVDKVGGKKHAPRTKQLLFVKKTTSGNQPPGQPSGGAKRSRSGDAHDSSAPIQDPVAKALGEIGRLLGVVRTSLQAMRQTEENARGELDTKPEKLVFAEDIEEERRRLARAEGQATRLTHMVYMLGQQVAAVREQADRHAAAAGGIPRARRADLLARLAAALRSVVKIQQTFLQNMPYFGVHKEGMPKSYYELARVLQQLVFCCDTLQCEGDVEVTSGLLNLVSDIVGMGGKENAAPAAGGQAAPKSPVSKEKLSVAEKAIIIGSPDRQAVLRAGMDAILRARAASPGTAAKPRPRPSSARTPPRQVPRTPPKQAGRTPPQHPPVPPLALPTTPRTPRSARRDLFERQEKKGVLLPQAFQQRRVPPPTLPVPMGEAHYAEPTFSSRLKEQAVRPRSRTASPRRSASAPSSPHLRQRYPDSPSSHRGGYPGAPRSHHAAFPGSPPRSHRSNASRPTVRIDEAHNQYRSPAATLDASLNSLLQRTERAMNADVIADRLVDEAVEDVARHLAGMEEEADVSSQAASLASGSTMENLLHRLGEMEGEQDSIRRRWGTIGYEDERLPTRAAYVQTPREEGVLSPVPIIVSNVPGVEGAESGEQGFRPVTSQHVTGDEASAWVFTKPRPAHNARIEYLRPAGDERRDDGAPKPVSLYLSAPVMRNIREGRDAHAQHLRRISHAPVGRFDPLEMMDRIADDIYADCVGEVCRELEEINTDIASHVYSGEFQHVPRGTGVQEGE